VALSLLQEWWTFVRTKLRASGTEWLTLGFRKKKRLSMRKAEIPETE